MWYVIKSGREECPFPKRDIPLEAIVKEYILQIQPNPLNSNLTKHEDPPYNILVDKMNLRQLCWKHEIVLL